VEVDVETGKVDLVDFLSVGDVGSVVNQRSLHGQLNGGVCLGIAHALCQKLVVDPQYGLMLSRRFHHTKPLSILDIPVSMPTVALDMADPETPVGARGVGEPPVGAGYGAVMNAIADAVGVDVFRRAPVTPDIVLMSLEHGRRMHDRSRAPVPWPSFRRPPAFELFQPAWWTRRWRFSAARAPGFWPAGSTASTG
jgi:CO/xanthine dehydrogenase Mo-binding subunit